MRRLVVFSLAAAVSATACTSTRSAPPPGPASDAAAVQPTPPPRAAKVQTTSEANRASVEGAAEAPLRDLNVLRTKIPTVLLDAVADPYALPPSPAQTSKAGKPAKSAKAAKTAQAAVCAQLAALVAPLDDALGPDLDNPETKDQGLVYRGKDAALGMMAGAASDVIPFRSWVRKLSGAERHDKLVQNAITAGAVRRGYLKGLGEAHGCNPPATPSHQLTEVVAEQKAQQPPPRDRFKPIYPIR